MSSRLNEEGGNPVRHSNGAFASLKKDHEGCSYNVDTGEYSNCTPSSNGFSWTDKIIMDEMEKYGMNGVPRAESNSSTA